MAGSRAGAVAAVAIPLREAAARSGAENLDAHESGAVPVKCGTAPRDTTYRVAMYMVISKPQRMTSKDGFDHCIAISSSCIPHSGRPIASTCRFGAFSLSGAPDAGLVEFARRCS